MKLSISNIAWSAEHDTMMYSYLKEMEFGGLEIAPTRLFPENPYEQGIRGKEFAEHLLSQYNLSISSMQSILFGKNEKLFGTDEEKEKLFNYTKQAIDFASTIGCENLVFGAPKNRIIINNSDYNLAIEFFKELGDYAFEKKTILSLEPNPTIYGTNFLNYTEQAFEFVSQVDSKGFKVNLDVGTIIENEEDLSIISENISKINHTHISEPHLVQIQERKLHEELAEILSQNNYDRFVSIEMKKLEDIEAVKSVMSYVKEIFSCK